MLLSVSIGQARQKYRSCWATVARASSDVLPPLQISLSALLLSQIAQILLQLADWNLCLYICGPLYSNHVMVLRHLTVGSVLLYKHEERVLKDQGRKDIWL
jgi:hypothetical protein